LIYYTIIAFFIFQGCLLVKVPVKTVTTTAKVVAAPVKAITPNKKQKKRKAERIEKKQSKKS